MGLIKNKAAVFAAITQAMDRVEAASLDHFRRAVWAVFQELVYTTPQFSGKAAANWNIGLGSPDFSVDESMGEKPEDLATYAGITLGARHVGDNKWASEALEANKYKIRLIKRDTQVFISNAVTGDTDGGKSGESYLLDLQSPSYWANKLRDVNKPYETVQMVILMESWRLRMPTSAAGKDLFV
jgi:hypothetical protein